MKFSSEYSLKKNPCEFKSLLDKYFSHNLLYVTLDKFDIEIRQNLILTYIELYHSFRNQHSLLQFSLTPTQLRLELHSNFCSSTSLCVHVTSPSWVATVALTCRLTRVVSHFSATLNVQLLLGNSFEWVYVSVNL